MKIDVLMWIKRYLKVKVLFKYELDSKDGPSCFLNRGLSDESIPIIIGLGNF